MKAKKVLQSIRIDGVYIQAGTILCKYNDGWKLKDAIDNTSIIPSYINLDDKKYFENLIETKFKVDDIIIYKSKVYKINKIFNYDGGLRKSFIRFTIEHVNNSKDVIELSEKMINECSITKEYFFIDSKGKIQKTYLYLDLYVDSFRKIVNNMFDNIENARKHLQNLIK